MHGKFSCMRLTDIFTPECRRVEIAIHFLRQWLLNNWSGILSYAWEIFMYASDRHIHARMQARTHVECVFRGFVGNGSNWWSVLNN